MRKGKKDSMTEDQKKNLDYLLFFIRLWGYSQLTITKSGHTHV